MTNHKRGSGDEPNAEFERVVADLVERGIRPLKPGEPIPDLKVDMGPPSMNALRDAACQRFLEEKRRDGHLTMPHEAALAREAFETGWKARKMAQHALIKGVKS